MATISFHNEGDKARRAHNIRDAKVIEKEPHINPSGEHETWLDEKPRNAYHRLFDDSLQEYNERQTRPERKIKNYFNHISKDGKKHLLYEVVVSVGSLRNPVDRTTGKAILRDFFDGWTERNPNLELIGAYYHADEEGVPHVHLDYIPVAHGYTNGMETQTGLVRAFKEMGIEKTGRLTAQIQWEKRECDELERICNTYGITVEHPLEEGRHHIQTEDYKMRKELERVTEERNKAVIEAEHARSSALQAAEEAITRRQEAMKAKQERNLILQQLEAARHESEDAANETMNARKSAEEAKEKAIRAEKEAENARTETEKIKKDYSQAAESFNKLVRLYNSLLSAAKSLGITVDEKRFEKQHEIGR